MSTSPAPTVNLSTPPIPGGKRPSFGGAPKCVRCTTSVYAQELIQYDNKPYHNTCFKCIECKTTMTMSMVAQINGQLYCKNCFKKIFKREGKYSSFDMKDPTSGITRVPSPALDSIGEGGRKSSGSISLGSSSGTSSPSPTADASSASTSVATAAK